MTANQCPVCGKPTLLDYHGDYRMELPPNLVERFVVIPDAARGGIANLAAKTFSRRT